MTIAVLLDDRLPKDCMPSPFTAVSGISQLEGVLAFGNWLLSATTANPS